MCSSDLDQQPGAQQLGNQATGECATGLGRGLVGGVDGCFTNVVGLPVSTTRRLLERWGML